MSAPKSLAAEVRAAVGAEEFDLGNVEGSQVTDLVNAAFGTPFRGAEYVRITFVVGGGKKCRQKYHADLPKDLSQALGALGFQEDRGASACEQCQGTYKYQHDTDKDLKFMHVFPHVTIEAKGAGANGEEETWEELSPAQWCTICSLEELQGVVQKSSKVVLFSQRKNLLQELKKAQKLYEGCEQKMIAMEALTDEEQKLYDEAQALAEKVAWLVSLLEDMVEEGKLTAQEKSSMLEQLGAKVETLDLEISKAKEEGKSKKVVKLQEARETAASKAASLATKVAITHTLRHDKELRSLWKKLAALEKIENSRTPQPLEEIKKLRDKPDIEARIAELCEEGRGWFVPAGEYEARLEAAKEEATRAPAGKKGSSASGGGFSTVSAKGGGGRGKPSGSSNRRPNNNPYEMLFE
mmetsp:Transcript_22861/g.63471  ORF Transcript_22861/g.63471 Transcript_22861/m.63471 type:complete len:410 (-) Transcript_22861:130-1359(-)|eukprot:CAMPEP_0117670026 /NCGR_PEP_ID=MMETSP0804-20121206/12494_1 /TAXON_ID=1074897 /ORGANISM="Tetraselmis astigmatica, Strain CCMP880" /LENGTH=409 /DNA_ID=CAMNT_0005478219 /DNA_START=58 /DNA_END=1287 /DNA_ORIENTATION=-